MKLIKQHFFIFFISLLTFSTVSSQDYFFKNKAPFNNVIPTPEAFLGYPIGEQHTRHDLIVAYFVKLAEVSDRATIEVYGKTHENRKLVILTISNPENLNNLETIKQEHLAFSSENSLVKKL